MCKNKDNPVPSIDSLFNNKELKCIEEAVRVYMMKHNHLNANSIWKSIINKLENGVETDNEQPNLGLFEPSRCNMKKRKTYILRDRFYKQDGF